jgi:hypothetical protein
MGQSVDSVFSETGARAVCLPGNTVSGLNYCSKVRSLHRPWFQISSSLKQNRPKSGKILFSPRVRADPELLTAFGEMTARLIQIAQAVYRFLFLAALRWFSYALVVCLACCWVH